MKYKPFTAIGWLLVLPAFIVLVSIACIDPEVEPTDDYEMPLTELTTQDAQLVEQIDEDVNVIAIQGNYAYLGMYERLVVVDISMPAALQLVSQSDPFPDVVFDLALSGDHAFVANGNGGLRVVDISNPAQPGEVGHLEIQGLVEDVVISGSYAYLAVSFSGLVVVDISDPSHPVQAGFYQAEILSYGLSISGSNAYLADCKNGLRVIDISDPTHPAQVGLYKSAWRILAVTVSGNYAFISDWDALLRVVDVSEPAAPKHVGTIPGDYPSGVRKIVVSDNIAYLVTGRDGLRLFDITDLAHLRRLSSFDLPDNVEAIALRGNYAYLAGDYGGLQVVDCSNPAHPRLVGGD
jgi:hypothetical protein